MSRREPVAPLAHGGQRSADGGVDLDRAAKRVPSTTKISPSAIGVITANGERRLSSLSASRGRFVAAVAVVDRAPQ